MNDHYYTRVPQSESRPVGCEYSYRGVALSFQTDAGVFSKGEVDTGTRLLLEALPEEMSGEILDLGCGWGIIGISIARKWPGTRVTMADVNTRALVEGKLGEKDIEAFASGMDLGDFTAQPARLTILGPSLAEVVISEGKFHQVKRMFSAVGHEVLELHRRSFGPLELDPALAEGQWRELTKEELNFLRQAAGMGEA